MREINVMKMVRNSPKLIRFIDAGEDEEAFYIVQEWCRGGSVHDYIRNHHGGYGENFVASIARGTLRGLHHLHEKGIIHADVKCGNIYLADTSEDADVKLGDFGTALLMDSGPGKGIVEVKKLVGTPWYMAPENLRSVYAPTSDIWSLGVVTYQLLCGVLPFEGQVVSQVWKGILDTEPTFNGPLWEGVSHDAKEFVRMCTHKDHRHRPSPLECLAHPWLTRTDCSDRFCGTPLNCNPFLFELSDDAMTVTPYEVPYHI
jgi:serine/threonine protein kinase